MPLHGCTLGTLKYSLRTLKYKVGDIRILHLFLLLLCRVAQWWLVILGGFLVRWDLPHHITDDLATFSDASRDGPGICVLRRSGAAGV